MRNSEKTVGNMIDKQPIAYLSSIDDNGYPATRAMLKPRKRDGIQRIYFSTNTSSHKVIQYIENPKACAYFFDKRFFRGVMLQGTIEVRTDPEMKEMLWEDGDTMYYPEGVNDPDYCVLCLQVQRGRYYSNFKSENFEVPQM